MTAEFERDWRRRWTEIVGFGRLEIRRSVARIRQHPAQTAIIGVLSLFPLFGTVLAAVQFGSSVGANNILPLSAARSGAAIAWCLAAFSFVAAGADDLGGLERRSTLTVVAPGSVYAGYLCGRTALVAVGLVPAAVVASAAFGLTAGRPSTLVTGPLTVSLALCSAVAVGSTLGVSLVWLADRLQFLRRFKAEAVLVGSGSAFLAPRLFDVPSVFDLVSGLPVRYFADAAFAGSGLGTGTVALPAVAAGAVTTSVAVTALGGRLLGVVGRSDERDRGGEDAVDLTTGPTSLGDPRHPVKAVAVRLLVQSLRRPGRLTPVLPPLLLGVVALLTLAPETALVALPPAVLLYGSWAPGVVVLSEAFDRDHPATPTTVLAPTRSGVVSDGIVVAVAVVTVPVVGPAAGLAGFVAGLPDATVGVLTLSGVVWPPVMAAVAVVLSTFDLTRRVAVGLFTAAFLVPLTVGLVAPVALAASLPDSAVVPAAGVVTALFGIGGGVVARVAARRRVATFRAN